MTEIFDEQMLIERAQAARTMAYAPYSNYKVGAALLTEGGRVFTGCNVENAVYPAACCAERVAMFKAISEGQHHFRAIAVATVNGGTPCGICRQVMSEWAPVMAVLLVDEAGQVRRTTVTELLPDAFGPQDVCAG